MGPPLCLPGLPRGPFPGALPAKKAGSYAAGILFSSEKLAKIKKQIIPCGHNAKGGVCVRQVLSKKRRPSAKSKAGFLQKE